MTDLDTRALEDAAERHLDAELHVREARRRHRCRNAASSPWCRKE
jgi:hypothetical protein